MSQPASMKPKSRTPVLSDFVASGPPLLTNPDDSLVGRFTLSDTSTTIANTLRRCILVDTRSAGFRADLTNEADPGVVIRKNTSVIFNEMLAQRLTLIPLAVRRFEDFDPTRYQCVLNVKNAHTGGGHEILHVTAADFRVLEKQEDGSFVDAGAPAAGAMFPPDPITKQTALIVSLRPQWNVEQPAEEVDLTAYPVVGRGRDHMGFCPVSQCTFENTRDEDPVRQEKFFNEWLIAFKKDPKGLPIVEPSSLDPETVAIHRKEWSNMAIQRCFLVDENGEPNSFDFTIESVGMRPVRDIVAEGIQAATTLVSPYADSERSLADLGITLQPADSRMMNSIDLQFDGQEHTLGNLLQTLITEMYISNGVAESPLIYVGYKVRHPLHRVMTLRLGFREGVSATDALAREIVGVAAEEARRIFEGLGSSWVGVGGETETLDG